MLNHSFWLRWYDTPWNLYNDEKNPSLVMRILFCLLLIINRTNPVCWMTDKLPKRRKTPNNQSIYQPIRDSLHCKCRNEMSVFILFSPVMLPFLPIYLFFVVCYEFDFDGTTFWLINCNKILYLLRCYFGQQMLSLKITFLKALCFERKPELVN